MWSCFCGDMPERPVRLKKIVMRGKNRDKSHLIWWWIIRFSKFFTQMRNSRLQEIFMWVFLFAPLMAVANDSIINHINGSFSVETLHSSGTNLPFWLVHNRNGRYPRQGSSVQVASLCGEYDKVGLFNSSLRTQIGFDLTGAWSDRFDAHFNLLYAGLSFKSVKLDAGWFSDEENFSGLSSSNGHMESSLNARPYPKIRFGTNGFIPFFFFKERVGFKAVYDEGWLGENRYVENARLHHKSLFARLKISQSLWLTAGLNHYVYWGGVSPVLGPLPDDLQAYWLYISGRSGNEEFTPGDQINVAGDQLGAYYTELAFKQKNYSLTFYLSHPFEDHSGMELDNWRDNLAGVFLDFRGKSLINQVLYEFMYTVHQSGNVHLSGVMRGRDNYFNHSVYRSGHTNMGYAMSSPLFSPLQFNDGIVTYIENNRLKMHHVGLNGTLSEHLEWKGLMTFTTNRGTYQHAYDPERKQLSALLTLDYINESFPVDISVSVSGDIGELHPRQAGGLLKLSRKF